MVPPRAQRLALCLLGALALVLAAWAGLSPASSPPGRHARAAGVPAASVLVAAGDIACRPGLRRTATACHQAATAAVVSRLRPGVVALAGDIQYDRGLPSEYARGSFAPTWGRLRPRLRPVPGVHEYGFPGAGAYFSYFGAAAGPGRRGYYSYEVGAWHVIALNSNCRFVSCAAGSAQERWLRANLAADRRAHPGRCVLAYWHDPRFSSGFHGSSTAVAPLWNALYAAGADVVVSAHDHDYERFAPQDGRGRRDPVRGIREFVVGTGGVGQRPFRLVRPNSERRSTGTFGVLALTLRPGGYTWRFVPEPGRTFTDSGSASCR